MWQWNAWGFGGIGGIRILWAPDDGGDGDGGGDSNQTQNPGTNDGDGAGGDGGSGEIRLTSAQLAERLDRQARTAVNKLLSGLGFEKAADLKAAIERQRQADDANKSELQKANERIAAFEKEKQTWQQQRQDQALQLAVQATATELGIVDAEVALALVRSNITFDDDGTPQGVKAALTKLLADKPYLKGGTSTSPTNPPRQGATLTKADIEKMTPEQINANWEAVSKALEEGR